MAISSYAQLQTAIENFLARSDLSSVIPDFIPDFIPVTGLTDDLGILLWVINHVSEEIDKFILWEQNFSLQK